MKKIIKKIASVALTLSLLGTGLLYNVDDCSTKVSAGVPPQYGCKHPTRISYVICNGTRKERVFVNGAKGMGYITNTIHDHTYKTICTKCNSVIYQYHVTERNTSF